MLAYGYCRYSSDIQNEKSIEQQKNELEDYAKKNNIKIIKYYVDEAKSGRYDTRDSFQELINDACKSKEVQAVLVWKTDRFARKAMDSLYYRTKLEKVGIKLISITQPIDTETPEGKLMSTLLAGMDEYFSQNLASNVKRALKSNAQNCQFNGGLAPLGYDIVNKKYVINKRESIIVQEIFSMYIKGTSLIDIALNLNSKGYRTKKGKTFGKSSIYDIIGNEKYIGKYIFNKGTKRNHDGIRPDAIIFEDGIPQIIDKETFKKAMDRRKTKKHAENSAKRIYLLSGLIKCQCGGSYVGRTATKVKNGNTYKTGYYYCTNHNKLSNCMMPSLKQELLEQKVIDILTEELINKNTMDTIVANVNKQYKELQEDCHKSVESLKLNLKDIKKEMDNIVDIVCRGLATDTLLQKLDKLEKIKKNLEDEINFKNNISENNYITSDKIRAVLARDVLSLQDSSRAEIKKLIQKWIKKIEVTTAEVIIHFDCEDFLPPIMVARNGFEPSTCRV